MKIFGSKRTNSQPGELYATRADFCRVFDNDRDRLYLLSLLLTGDPELAEKCFVRGLEDSKGGNPVFKEWARSWARRRIITNAIAMIRPRREGVSSGSTDVGSRDIEGLPRELAAVLSLQTFDRFVFVMSMLEGYPERDVRLLLDCSSADISQARVRAFDQISATAQQYGTAENGIDRRELKLASMMVPPLAASASFLIRG
jgi:DNA-directed RNA polymerase specialized sigma24 family protein